MLVAVLATGGKDSTLALFKALRAGHRVKYLASMIPLREDSWMFHYPNIRLVDLFAEAVDIPLAKAETSGVKEEEVEDLKRLIEKLGVEGLVSGAIASEYQKARVEQICEVLNLKCISPLWHKNPIDILREIIKLKFDVIITGVSAYGFDPEWLARRIDDAALKDLIELNRKYGISVVGEGGEYETLVLNGPLFKKRITIIEGKKVWKDQSGYFSVKTAILENK